MRNIPGLPRDRSRAVMDFDGGGQSQVVQSNASPWTGQQPYLTFGFGEAQRLYNNGPYGYFPNSGVVPFSGQTQQGLQGMEARALAGSPLRAAGMDEAMKTIRGDYLSAGNPYFSQMAGRISSEVTPQIAGTFSDAGRYGSGAAANATASALSDTLGQLGFQNYTQERGNQLATAMQAPALAETDYADLGHLMQTGAIREGKAGEELQDEINRFNFNQAAPDEALRRLMSLVAGGQYGGQNVQSVNRNTSAADIASGLFGLAGTGLALKKFLG